MKIDGRRGTKAEMFYNTDNNTIDLNVQDEDGEWSTAVFSLGKAKQFDKAWKTCISRLEENERGE